MRRGSSRKLNMSPKKNRGNSQGLWILFAFFIFLGWLQSFNNSNGKMIGYFSLFISTLLMVAIFSGKINGAKMDQELHTVVIALLFTYIVLYFTSFFHRPLKVSTKS